jgi:hypothetical protein
MKKFLIIILLATCFATGLIGQIATKNIVVANGGAYSDPNDYVTVTAFDPATGTTENLATIHTHSVQGLLVINGVAFVAAQDSLARINIDQGAVEAIVALPGVNKFAVHGDKLLVSRQFPVTADFVQVRNINDLSLIKSFPEVSDEAWEIMVVNDSAYISVAGSWMADVGKLAVIDLANMEFVREMNLGDEAVGIGRAFLLNEHLIFTCKTPYGGTQGKIIKYDINSCGYEIHLISGALGKAAGIWEEMLYVVLDGNIGTISINDMTVIDPVFISNPFTHLEITGLVFDEMEESLYINFSYWIPPDGIGIIYDLFGNQMGSYPVGVSAEEVAPDHREVTYSPNFAVTKSELQLFPNPCTDKLVITNLPAVAGITIFDLTGKKLIEFAEVIDKQLIINVSELKSGAYLLAVKSNSFELVESTIFIKQ